MASSNQERGNSPPQPSSPITPNSDEKHTDSTSPPVSTAYPAHPPPSVGYPTGQNTHAYPQGYTLYTNPYPHNTPYYGPPPNYHTSGACTRFYRSFILCSCLILTFLFLLSLVIALVLRPELPLYKVVSLSVTNFTTTPTLAGQWGTNLIIENPNQNLVAVFSEFKVDVVYKDGLLAANQGPSFVLEKHDKLDVDVKASSGHVNGNMLEKTTLDDLVKERNTGSVTLALRVSSVNMFKSGSFSTRSTEVMAFCEGLKVVFQNNTDTGRLDNRGKPIDCQRFV